MVNDKKEQTISDVQLRTLTAQDLEVSAVAPISPRAFSVCVRSLLQGWRQGTVGSQGRSDVSLTNKKPWKQKGTGRARAGSARSPLWRGGGVIFGPQERTRLLKINKKVRKSALATVFNTYLTAGKIVALDWQLMGFAPKTSQAHTILKQLSLVDKKVILFVAQGDMLTYASFINLPNVSVLYFDQPNAFDLMNCDRWMLLNKDMDRFKEMVSQWN
jgi:large subunit ribosomal protein L4